MNIKTKLIDLYRTVTSPFRSIRLKRMVASGTVPVGVLFYHRVDDTHLNDWTITFTRFREQIDWLSKNFDLVSLDECQRRIQSGFNDRPTLSITFDDGYADNCCSCIPFLLERDIPVTYFVTTYHTLEQQPFDHDVKYGVPLDTNQKEALKAMHNAGVVIGAHTRSHPNLGVISDVDVLFDEVITATREMEEVIGAPIKHFAFPYGQIENLNARVFQLCKEQGFTSVSSAYGGFNQIGGDAFHIRRFHGDPSLARIKNWLTHDPRWIGRTDYDYLAEIEKLELTKPAKPGIPSSPDASLPQTPQSFNHS